MRVLIVGAGAVGQVYGYYLQRGGAEVSFYVRPKYVEELKRGLVLYPLNEHKKLDRPVRMTGYGVVATEAEVSAETWDYVILCTHSGAVHTPWFEPFAKAVKGATFVNLHPEVEARREISKYFPQERQIDGLITLISYMAPLPGENAKEPGVAFWFPPLTQVPFQGAEKQVNPLIETYRRGGFPCKRDSSQGDTAATVAADTILSIFVLALEGAGWKFADFLKPAQTRLAGTAMVESFEVQCRARGLGQPSKVGLKLVSSRLGLRTILSASRCLMPFDLETYLRVHFTKIADQRREGLARTFEYAKQNGIAVPALETLARQAGSL